MAPSNRDEMERPAPLSIGAVYGGSPEIDELWRPDIRRLMKEVIALRGGIETPLNVNVVFHIDGRLLPPLEFEGVRTGRLSRKSMHLMVQAAVPREPQLDRRKVLVGLLNEALIQAENLARRRKIADGLPTIRGIVDRLLLH